MQSLFVHLLFKGWFGGGGFFVTAKKAYYSLHVAASSFRRIDACEGVFEILTKPVPF